MKSGSSAGTTTPFVAAQAASAGMVVWLLQMPFRATVPLASSLRQISPVPALDSTDPAGQLPLVSLLTTYTWMLELPPPWTKLLRIRTSPSLDVTEKSRDRRGAENEKAFRCGRFGVARPTSPPSTKGHSQCGGEERICGGGSMGIWSYGSGARD